MWNSFGSSPGTPGTPGGPCKRPAWDFTPVAPRPKKKVKSSRCGLPLDMSKWGKTVKTYEDVQAAHVVTLFRIVLPGLWNDPRQNELTDVEPTMAAAFHRFVDSPMEPLGCESPAAWIQTLSLQYHHLGQPLKGKSMIEVRQMGETLMDQHKQEVRAQQQASYEAMQQGLMQNHAMMRRMVHDAQSLQPDRSMWSPDMMRQQQQAFESSGPALPWWQPSMFAAGPFPSALWQQHPHQEVAPASVQVLQGLGQGAPPPAPMKPVTPVTPVTPVAPPANVPGAVSEALDATHASVGEGSIAPGLRSGLPGNWFSFDSDGHLYIKVGERSRRLHRYSSGGADDYAVSSGTLSSAMLGISVSLFDLLADTEEAAEAWPAP